MKTHIRHTGTIAMLVFACGLLLTGVLLMYTKYSYNPNPKNKSSTTSVSKHERLKTTVNLSVSDDCYMVYTFNNRQRNTHCSVIHRLPEPYFESL